MSNFLVKEWDPLSVIGLHRDSSCSKPYATLVLNTAITLERNILFPLWNTAALRITVDGGTNRLYSWQVSNGILGKDIRPPEYITGDMDSVNESVLHHFMDSTEIIYTMDQNQTDFTKALIELTQICKKKALEIEDVVVLSDARGRLDHIMANINTLFKAQKLYPNLNIYQLGNESISWLLGIGEHKIHIPECVRSKSEWCALIPIGKECECISTTGLRWNLENSTMKFGELVSTSNTYSGASTVTVHTSDAVLWSMSIYGLSQSST